MIQFRAYPYYHKGKKMYWLARWSGPLFKKYSLKSLEYHTGNRAYKLCDPIDGELSIRALMLYATYLGKTNDSYSFHAELDIFTGFDLEYYDDCYEYLEVDIIKVLNGVKIHDCEKVHN